MKFERSDIGNIGVDCSGLYHDDNRILNTFTNKPIHTKITKAEYLALENLRKDKDHIIVKADKGVVLVVMDKTESITKCEALLQENSNFSNLTHNQNTHIVLSPHPRKAPSSLGLSTQKTINTSHLLDLHLQ